jgi:hypothetical protein
MQSPPARPLRGQRGKISWSSRTAATDHRCSRSSRIRPCRRLLRCPIQPTLSVRARLTNGTEDGEDIHALRQAACTCLPADTEGEEHRLHQREIQSPAKLHEKHTRTMDAASIFSASASSTGTESSTGRTPWPSRTVPACRLHWSRQCSCSNVQPSALTPAAAAQRVPLPPLLNLHVLTKRFEQMDRPFSELRQACFGS